MFLKNTIYSKDDIDSLNPLCTLGYSATHVDKHNCVYKLDAIDAFEMNLVKQIEVASFATADYKKKRKSLQGRHGTEGDYRENR